jgi:ATP-binding cassette subfamily B protein
VRPPDPPLVDGESVLASFEPDLDARYHFHNARVVLTEERVLASTGQDASWQAYPLQDVATIEAHEHSGLGRLELRAPDRLIEAWRYTSSHAPAAHRFVEQFDALRRSSSEADSDAARQNHETSRSTCPRCGLALREIETRCPVCSPESTTPRVRTSLFRLIRFAKPHAAMAALGLTLTLASTLIGLVPTYLTAPLTNRVLIPLASAATAAESAEPLRLAAWYIVALAAAALTSWALSWARARVLTRVSERVAVDLRDQTYAHLQRLSLEFFGGKRTGDLISRISSDTDRINNFLSVNLLEFATDLFMIVATSAVLFTMDPVLAVASLGPFPIIYFMVYRSRVRMRHGFDRANRAWSGMTSVLADTIPGIRVVKAFAQEDREIERFAASDRDVLEANDRVNALWSFFWPTVALWTALGLLVVWIVGIGRVASGAILPGHLIAFQLFISRFYVRMEALSRIVQSIQRAAASSQRVFEILDRTPSVPETPNAICPGRLHGRIEIRDVEFRYGSRTVLNEIDLSIRPGEMIGLVGHSGAGKSTLVNLICRFFDVRMGSIEVDGTDIRRYAIEGYRRNIGIVLQEPFLFYGTVAENIAYGRPDATREEIIAAARAARAHEFILKLTDGYDSMVGERGQALSGGERQRISIARAILIDPAILILDEATSSVDTETERQIQEALENLIRGRTTIAIAHRLSTLRRADRLVVLEQGRVVEVGSHSELLESDGPYSRFHQAQLELSSI